MRIWQKRFARWKLVAVLAAAVFVLAPPIVHAADNAADAKGDTPAAEDKPAAQTAPEAAEAPDEAAAARKWFRGRFEAGIDAAWSDWDSDIDFDQSLAFEAEPPCCERLKLRGMVWLDEDLDSGTDSYSALHGINDAYDSDIRANVLYLYGDVTNTWGQSVLRIGRQRVQESPFYNRIDGIYFQQRLSQWDWYLFGGTRASLYRDPFKEPVAGAGVAWQPAPSTRLALDGYQGWEHRNRDHEVHRGPLASLFGLTFPREVKDDVEDGAVALSAWRTLGPNMSLYGRYEWQEGDGDEVRLSLTGQFPKYELTYELAYRAQLNSVGDHVNDLTAFYRILGPLEPYRNFLAALHKPIGKKLALSLEAEIHDSQEDRTLGGNRDYERYAVVLGADDLWHGVGGQLAMERWNVSGDEGTWAVTGELEKKWKDWLVAVGADYEQYEDRLVKYQPWLRWADQLRILLIPGQFETINPFVLFFDTYTPETRWEVHSFYVKTKWSVCENQDLSARVTYEMDESPESPYWRVQASYEIRF